MKLEVLDDVLEEAYAEQSDAFVEFIESYIPGKTMTGSLETMSWGYESSRSHIDPLLWLSQARQGFRSVRRKNFTGQSG